MLETFTDRTTQPASSPPTEVIPVTFGPHRGALHRATGDNLRGLTVVICSAPGRDGRCAYRPLFLWAEMLAARGFQVLRYDLHGEGDSGELHPAADQWSHWLEGVRQAGAFAATETGATGVVMAGLRMGATLAAVAAQELKLHGLLMLAPLLSGKAWIRELQWAAAIQRTPADADGTIEVDGLRLSAATIESVQKVDLSRIRPNWRAAYLAGPPSLANALAEQLGPDLTSAPFPEQAKLFTDARLNERPTEAFVAAAAWLETLASAVPTIPNPRSRPLDHLGAADWVEEGVTFGNGLRGVICLPKRRNRSQAVIFGNTGGDPRAGIGNFAARASRALAANGVAALRFDFRGLGESAANGEEWRTHVYLTSRLDDYRHASTVLSKQGYHDVVPIGVCTGGFHAVRAVLAGVGFRRAIAINSWFIWRPLEFRPEIAITSPAKLRIFGCEIELERLVKRLGVRLRQRWSYWWPDGACRAVRKQMATAARRGARMHFVFGRGDQAEDGLERDFGPKGRWLRRQPGLTVAILRGLDHALFSVASQEMVIREIRELLELDVCRAASGAHHETSVELRSAPSKSGPAGRQVPQIP